MNVHHMTSSVLSTLNRPSSSSERRSFKFTESDPLGDMKNDTLKEQYADPIADEKLGISTVNSNLMPSFSLQEQSNLFRI